MRGKKNSGEIIVENELKIIRNILGFSREKWIYEVYSLYCPEQKSTPLHCKRMENKAFTLNQNC